MFRVARTVCVLIGAAWSGLPAAGQEGVRERGYVFFETGFESAEAVAGWTGTLQFGPGADSRRSLFFESPPGATRSVAARFALPVAPMRGYLVYFSALVKAENIGDKPQSWNGVKFMAPMVAGQARLWPQASIGTGTFDWTRVVFPVRVPSDATELALHLGLEAVGGRVWFDDIRVTVRKPPLLPVRRAARGPVYKGHDLTRLRGAMVSPDIDEEGLRVLGQHWNANLVRWQLIRRGRVADPLDLAAYDRWLDTELKKLDAVLPWCEKYGLMVVVDLHSPPGGRVLSGGYAGAGDGLFSDAACQKKFVEVWQRIARRYQGARAIWGFDLANEPVENVVHEQLADWEELAERAGRAIQAIDPRRNLIVEPAEWGGPQGLAHFRPLDLPHVVYSVHMYVPHSFTHQGVGGARITPLRPYPGEIDGRNWDQAALADVLGPVVEFQKTYGVHIYVGEFSAIRWAPDGSAYRYLRDLVDLFEQNGWDWTYHAFREWHGWSVEHGPDAANDRPLDRPTDRQELLLGWFSKNRKPAWWRSP
jgi:hypothetical protein